MSEIRTGLTYDDAHLVPRRSRVRSRQDVSTRSRFTPGIELEVPIVSATRQLLTASRIEKLPLVQEDGTVVGLVTLRGSVAEVIEEIHCGLRSAMSYVDAPTIGEPWERASFIRQTEAGERESHPGSS